jgi:hypothetical protein
MKLKSMALMATGICCLMALACAGSTPSATVKAFYHAVGKGNTDEAVGLMSEQIVSMVGRDKLRAGLQEATRKSLAKGGLDDVQIVDEKTAGEVATVVVLLKYKNGTSERETVQLVKEKDGWRLKPHK